MSVENKVVVKIFGEEYPITSGGDPTYVSKIADYVDSRMQEVAKRCNSRARDKVAILTALSLASELHEKSDDLDVATSEQGQNLDALLARLDTALLDN